MTKFWSMNEKDLERDSERSDVDEENSENAPQPLQELFDFLNLKLYDIDDEETTQKCHALIAFHNLVVSQCDDLKDQSAKLVTASKGIHTENNPLWMYLSSALQCKIEEMRKMESGPV